MFGVTCITMERFPSYDNASLYLSPHDNTITRSCSMSARKSTQLQQGQLYIHNKQYIKSTPSVKKFTEVHCHRILWVCGSNTTNSRCIAQVMEPFRVSVTAGVVIIGQPVTVRFVIHLSPSTSTSRLDTEAIN